MKIELNPSSTFTQVEDMMKSKISSMKIKLISVMKSVFDGLLEDYLSEVKVKIELFERTKNVKALKKWKFEELVESSLIKDFFPLTKANYRGLHKFDVKVMENINIFTKRSINF